MLSRPNNLDAVRFWAAMLVLWSHSVPLTEGSEQDEISFRLSQGQTTTGSLAVFVFFALSGYLITRSFERARSPWHFVRARVLRIMPALLVMLAVVAFLIGPIASELSLRSYFGSPDPYRFFLVQGSMFVGWFDGLPGVFADHPMPVVNGPIWTLRYEVECYGLVFLLGSVGLLRKELTLALYIAALVAHAVFPGVPGQPGQLPDPNEHLMLGAGFLAGALIYQWKVPLDGRAALASLLGMIALTLGGEVMLAQRTLLPYLAIYVALAPSIPTIPYPWRGKDVSYGLYIWAWPISQLVIQALGRPSWLTMAAVTTPLALGAGWLSWQLVEKRALALKDHPLLGGKRGATHRHAHG